MAPESDIPRPGIFMRFKHSLKVIGSMIVLVLAAVGLFTILYFLLFRGSRLPQAGLSIHAEELSGSTPGDSALSLSLPVTIPGTHNLLVYIQRTPTGRDDLEWSSKRGKTPIDLNAVVLAPDSSRSILVFQRRVVIKEVRLPPGIDERQHMHIVYEVVQADANQDGMLDGADNTVLYCTDLDGRNLVQMTPDSMAVVQWKYDNDSEQAAILVASRPGQGNSKREQWPTSLWWYDFGKRMLFRPAPIDSLLTRAAMVVKG